MEGAGEVEGGRMSGLLGYVVIVLLSACETKSFPNSGVIGRRAKQEKNR